MSRGCLMRRPYPRDTRETQLSPSVLTLRIPVICRAHALLRGMLSRKIPAKISSVFNSLSLHTLSLYHTTLQSNPTINTGYKRLIKITIKFGTELKSTKHIVVNHNFTSFSILFLISVLYSVFVFISMLCIIYFVLLRYCYYVLSTSHLYPSRILFLDANTSCILHWLCVGHAIDHCGWSSLHCMSG